MDEAEPLKCGITPEGMLYEVRGKVVAFWWPRPKEQDAGPRPWIDLPDNLQPPR